MTQIHAGDELPEGIPLYYSAPKVYPQRVHGVFRTIKTIILFVTLGIYFVLPFVRWDRGPDAPNQAVLVDFGHRKFYFFNIEIWPQEVYYLTGLLILAALILFLMNALAGRVWCGYLCPQTVWTDLFFWTERLYEGDRRERILLDAAPWTARKIRIKALKHATWLFVAFLTGLAFTLYFGDAPTMVRELVTFQAAPTALIWIFILLTSTYIFAGIMREQICVYMCPWPRIQAALTDENALNVTYRYDRGEPRTHFKKAEVLRAHGEKAGDCIDCGQCVAVCPTGVDIREGPNLGCIQCGLCIDACDHVMRKVARPTGLIAYDTDLNVERRIAGQPNVFKPVRSRTILYAAVIALVGGVMLAALIGRQNMSVAMMHDRNPMFVTTADGSVRNALTAHIVNRGPAPRRFSIEVVRPAGAQVSCIGIDDAHGAAPVIEVGPDQVREVRVLVSVPPGSDPPRSQPLVFNVTDVASGKTVVATDHFFAQ
jgi:cytochrome c oxidase accessory protein FixG